MRVAVLDLGSNSFQIFVADAGADGRIDPVFLVREMLYLGGAVGRHGGISDEEARRAVTAAGELLRQGLDTGPDEVVVVATSALRDATNGADVVAQIERRIGLPVRVLSGREEARFAYLGACAGLPGDGRPSLVLDLGGGSIELAAGRGAVPDWLASVPVGVSRLAAEAEIGDVLSAGGAQRLRRIVRERLEPVCRQVTPVRGHRVAVSGGAARAVARVVLASREPAASVDSLHGREVSVKHIHSFSRQMVGKTLEDRLMLPGARVRRSLHLPIAAVVVSEVSRGLGARSLVVSDWSLRHGLILDAVASRSVAAVS